MTPAQLEAALHGLWMRWSALGSAPRDHFAQLAREWRKHPTLIARHPRVTRRLDALVREVDAEEQYGCLLGLLRDLGRTAT